ncbi:MAG: radical SAM protein [Gammaproteobacteria bacterium]
MKIIYIENTIKDHPRTKAICDRYPDAVLIPCDHYGEIFNRKAQNFRLQKKQPALILARKHDNLVLDAPEGYGIGGKNNFYFSHMLNCVYDCRYCFLQGMYRSAHHVVFVNYEDFETAIENKFRKHPGSYFFTGYDCDSLAFEPVTGFVSHFLSLFARSPDSWIELRTKSTQIRKLLKTEPLDNCIVAFSFTPEEISRSLEHGVPVFERRLEAMAKLQNKGWLLGLRIDPLIYHPDYRLLYRKMFEQIFATVNGGFIHSISLGAFRVPKAYFKNIVKLFPDEKLFAGPVSERDGMYSYQSELENELLTFCRDEIIKHVPESLFFSCTPPSRKLPMFEVQNFAKTDSEDSFANG